mmetsp:Transcript_6936/g.13814  ORF Transcript_6936/g.13814 Transcript_6936/m.13814 type:complete len:300 (+) Transcript_6936:42-941(+)
MSADTAATINHNGDGTMQKKRRGNMKKLNRGQRKRLKKRKEVIAVAMEKGEDPDEALKKAGLLEDGVIKEEAKKGNEDGEEKSVKAKKRIEQLKRKRKHADGTEASLPMEDVLWNAYSKAFGYASNVRQSSGLAACSMHPASPATIDSLEYSLKRSENRWKRFFATPPVENPAHPHAIFISPSALGSLDCIKKCPEFHAGCPMAKLFAKHMKVEEQASLLQKNPICIGVGTPNRILKLAKDNHVSFSNLSHLILDMRRNKKNQTLVDIPEIAADFWSLWESFLKQGVVEKSIKILIVGD